VDFKILVHVYKVLHDQSPIYVKDLLELYQPARNLRSQNSKQLVVPKSRTVRYVIKVFRQLHRSYGMPFRLPLETLKVILMLIFLFIIL